MVEDIAENHSLLKEQFRKQSESSETQWKIAKHLKFFYAYFAQKQRKPAFFCHDSGGSIPSKRLPNAQTLHEIP